jgi:uncharacterized protein (DUF1501 family)
MNAHPSRRALLVQAARLGFGVSLVGQPAFATSDREMARRKIVVIVCRGGMDGLSVSPPYGDPGYAALRGAIALQSDQILRLDDTFGLHPELATVHRLARLGQARIAPAIASPDRARSHFEAQDVLEAGTSDVYGSDSGWLNRTLDVLGQTRRIGGLSVGTSAPLILRGKVQAANWTPGRSIDETARLPRILQDLYATDPLMGPAFARGLETESMAQMALLAAPERSMASGRVSPGMGGGGGGRQGREAARALGSTLAGFMTQADGPQVAALSQDGFDTHAGQVNQIATRLAALDALLEGLNAGLGGDWNKTVVIVVTEFGRTARVNGTAGTDHGTASTALLLGGSLKPGGGIIGDWPTLSPKALFEDRDLAPTLDVRSLLKGVLAEHMGIEARALDSVIFPDSQAAPALLGLV